MQIEWKIGRKYFFSRFLRLFQFNESLRTFLLLTKLFLATLTPELHIKFKLHRKSTTFQASNELLMNTLCHFLLRPQLPSTLAFSWVGKLFFLLKDWLTWSHLKSLEFRVKNGKNFFPSELYVISWRTQGRNFPFDSPPNSTAIFVHWFADFRPRKHLHEAFNNFFPFLRRNCVDNELKIYFDSLN